MIKVGSIYVTNSKTSLFYTDQVLRVTQIDTKLNRVRYVYICKLLPSSYMSNCSKDIEQFSSSKDITLLYEPTD